MKEFWIYISLLGTANETNALKKRSVILCNQLNAIMLAIMFFLLILLRIMAIVEGAYIGVGSLRVFLLFLLNFFNLYLSKKGFHAISKISTVFLPPVLFLLFPTLIGFVEEESFMYYPYILIAQSVIPTLIFIPKTDKNLYHFSIIYYIVLVIIIDTLLVYFSPQDFIIIDRIKKIFIFNKVAQISIFLFINISVYYLRRLNEQYEEELSRKNSILDIQNEELKKTLHDLKYAQQQLVQSEKMAALGTLTAGVAHEINNPLNYISGGVNIINEIIDDCEKSIKINDFKNIKDSIMMIETGVTKANNILKSLMIYSYRGKSEKKLTNIHEIIESVISFLNIKIDKKITIEKKFKLDKHIPVFRDKLHEILMNIVDNAIYAIKSRGIAAEDKIIISTNLAQSLNEEVAVITVFNSGPAISDKIIHRIFEPFYTTKEPGEGTGLGLSISYNLIKEHKGKLMVRNVINGVEFIIELPLII